MDTATALTVVAAVLGGLTAGVFLAFSTFVVQGLDRNPAPVAIRAMQGINVTAPHPLFMLPLFGGPLVGVAAARDRGGLVEVAVAAVVTVRVDAAYGAIAPGDLLTTSETPGTAMRAASPGAGTILGKALEGLEAGVGTLRVLLMLR